MADYRLSVSTAKRSEGRSATAMAAYRAGEKVYDDRTGERFDYTRKSGVLYTGILAPEGAPEWAHRREELWNRSEAAHKVAKAVVAREIHLSLPHELTDAGRWELTREFGRFVADTYGVAVDAALHAPGRGGDDRNHHAHLLLCTRTFDASKAHGLGNNVRDFDAVAAQRNGQGNQIEMWRSTWGGMVNQALDRARVVDAQGVAVTVDHRSYKRQGIDREPTIKEGLGATAKKRRGEYTERAEINSGIRSRNEEWKQLSQETESLNRQLQSLYRRRADEMTAEQLRAELAPAVLTPAILAPVGMIPSNDNEAPMSESGNALPWETAEQAQKAAEKAREWSRQQANEQRDHKPSISIKP